jgi:16S rRNA (cytidine1402-2'-O)-methyltransferase
MVSQSGTLYVVATPIGNLEDISSRALKTLTGVDKILAEDTRRTQQLLTHFGIKGSLVSLHDHNERQRIEQVIDWLQQGLQLALVSDAGTPLISDPGYVLVQALRQQGLSVVPVPGPSAIITALSAAGLPTDRFCFEGFLAAKSSARKKQLELLRQETRTCVFYESSHRIMDCLQDMQEVLGDEREVVLARELTKRFETFLYGSLARVTEQVSDDDDQQRGEFVVMIKGVDVKETTSEMSAEQVLRELLPHLPTKQAAQIAANLTGLSKRELYQMALTLKASLA